MYARGPSLLLSCEHAGNWVPTRYQALFVGDPGVLHTHEGFDLGAADVARHLSNTFGAPLREQRLSRLLIDCNRSPGHKGLFSRFSRILDEQDKDRLRALHAAHRDRIAEEVRALITEGGLVVHLAIHSFTPVLNGHVRDCDVGLLYDPRREMEQRFCARFKDALLESQPTTRVRRNYPYKGRADGLCTSLRKELADHAYVGVEVEINQGLLMESAEKALSVTRLLETALEKVGIVAVGSQHAARTAPQ